MSGRILELAIKEAKRFLTSGGFEETITIKTPDESHTLTLTGFASKHWINFDTDGAPVNSKNAHVTIDESVLSENGYPVRNSSGEVNLKAHRVFFPDSTGIIKSYVVKEYFPDETLGLIALILGDYRI